MRREEITRSIEAGDVAEIQRAYHILADYPRSETIEAADPHNLMSAMDRVTTALEQDRGIMPSEICEAARLRPGTTYAEATIDFRTRRDWWVKRFQSVLGGN